MGSKEDPVLITVVDTAGPAYKAGVRSGDRLTALNGRNLRDVIDYELAREADTLGLDLIRRGREFQIRLDNREQRPIGMAFEKSIFDRQKECINNCLFCFIDQLPPGCRPALNIKDDDFRLSFLYGNFITLTNLSRADLKRIDDQRLSPLYVSIHSTDLKVRRRLVKPPETDRALENLKYLLDAGIDIHLQIVVCPGINDGENLANTINTLLNDFSAVASIGIVPVGLTGHRDDLPSLTGFTGPTAKEIITELDVWQKKALKSQGYRWVYVADEFYLKAGVDLPSAIEYDDYPQVENGIGLARIFMDEVDEWLRGPRQEGNSGRLVYLLTSGSAAPVLKGMIPALTAETRREYRLLKAANNWLGGQVSVAGLLSGSDIIEVVRDKKPTGLVVFPDICLNPDGLFLDGLRVADVEREVDVEVLAVPSRGKAFLEALAKV